MCPHAVEPDYALQSEETYRRDLRISRLALLLAACVAVVVIWRILA